MATMTIYASSVSGTGWANPSNARGESDSSYATVTLARNTTRTLTASFTNSLPTGATINRITAYCRLYRSNTTTLSISTLGGTTVTIPTSVGNVSYNAGTTFPTSVSLKVRTTQRNNLPTIYVDSFWLEVDYTEYVPTIESASVSPSSVTLNSKGATQQLTGSYSPSDLSGVTTSWESNNNSVATVSSSGLVTAVANGTATITYSATYDGITKTATCSVTVNIPRLFPYEIDLLRRMEEIATTETGATLITTEQDQQSDVYYKLPLEIGKSYKISFDYETNCGSFYISVRNRTLSPNYYLLEEQNIKDTLSGHLEYTFSNDYESAIDYASFCIKTFRNDVTFTFSNFTLTEITESGTNLIRLGSIQPTAFYLGNTPVKKIYLGETLVYE